MLVLQLLFGYAALFGVVLAFKLIWLDHKREGWRPGGFEVRLSGTKPAQQKEENDHG